MTEANLSGIEIKEIRIKKVAELSCEAQQEVQDKLSRLPENFNFIGNAKVSYAETSPLRIVQVDPIEGDIIDELNRIKNLLKAP